MKSYHGFQLATDIRLYYFNIWRVSGGAPVLERFVFSLIAYNRYYVGDHKNFGNFNVDIGYSMSQNTRENCGWKKSKIIINSAAEMIRLLQKPLKNRLLFYVI